MEGYADINLRDQIDAGKLVGPHMDVTAPYLQGAGGPFLQNADLFLVNGDPSQSINDIENVELVIKDGVAFDPEKLISSVKGRYGQY